MKRIDNMQQVKRIREWQITDEVSKTRFVLHLTMNVRLAIDKRVGLDTTVYSIAPASSDLHRRSNFKFPPSSPRC